MRRRRLLLVVGAVAMAGVGGFFLFLSPSPVPTPGVTWDNFRRLRQGMSASYVKALLGEPSSVQGTLGCWWGDEVVIDISFEGDRLAVGVAYPVGPYGRPELSAPIQIVPIESFLDRIRRWLPW